MRALFLMVAIQLVLALSLYGCPTTSADIEFWKHSPQGNLKLRQVAAAEKYPAELREQARKALEERLNGEIHRPTDTYTIE